LAGDDVVVMPRELPGDGQHEHQGVLRDRDRVGPAVVGDRDPRPARRRDVEAVVAGADELDELQLRRAAIEIAAQALAREAHEVLGVLHGGGELRRALVCDLELELGRQERASDVDERGRELGGENDLVAMAVSFVCSPASAGGVPAPRRPAARTSAGYRSFFMSSGKFDVNEYDLTAPLALKRTDRSLLAVAEARR